MSSIPFERSGHTGPQRETPGQERTVGGILLDSGKITPADAERALRVQNEKGLRFGEACISLGLVTRADIDQVLSGQFNYPYLQPGKGALSGELLAAYSPFSPEVEELRAVRAQLLLRWFPPEGKALAICSPARGDGRSHLAANLAIVFSQLGENTLLIDADLRAPRQHQLFNLPNRIGLSAALAGRAGPEAVDRIPHFANLSVLAAGAIPPNPIELLNRAEFPHLLELLSRRYPVILIDTPASELGVDAQTVAVAAGGALLLARRGHTRVEALRALATDITNGRATVVGSVYHRS